MQYIQYTLVHPVSLWSTSATRDTHTHTHRLRISLLRGEEEWMHVSVVVTISVILSLCIISHRSGPGFLLCFSLCPFIMEHPLLPRLSPCPSTSLAYSSLSSWLSESRIILFVSRYLAGCLLYPSPSSFSPARLAVCSKCSGPPQRAGEKWAWAGIEKRGWAGKRGEGKKREEKIIRAYRLTWISYFPSLLLSFPSVPFSTHNKCHCSGSVQSMQSSTWLLLWVSLQNAKICPLLHQFNSPHFGYCGNAKWIPIKSAGQQHFLGCKHRGCGGVTKQGKKTMIYRDIWSTGHLLYIFNLEVALKANSLVLYMYYLWLPVMGVNVLVEGFVHHFLRFVADYVKLKSFSHVRSTSLEMVLSVGRCGWYTPRILFF